MSSRQCVQVLVMHVLTWLPVLCSSLWHQTPYHGTGILPEQWII